jgi:O-antigen/teichoic acid export membrane protein
MPLLMAKHNSYASSTLIRLLAIGLNAVGALLLLPFVLNALGATDFGIWAMATSITGYLLLLDFGIALACTRYLSVYAEDKQQWRRTFSSAFLLSLGLAAILGCVAIAVQLLLYSGVLPAAYQPLPDVITLLLAEVALSIPLRLYQSILRAQVRYVDIGLFEIVRIVLRLVGIPLLLWVGGGLMTILVYASVINVLFFALMLGSVYRRERTTYLDWQAWDGRHVRELLRFSQYAAVTQVAEFFKYRTDNLLVGVLLGVSAVAPYAIMVVVIDMLTQILMRFQSYWDTIIMRHAGEQRLASALDTTLTSLQIGMALALLATFDTWLLGAHFLTLWVGDTYAALATSLALFTLILPGLAVQLATSPYFNALGRQRTNATLALLEIVLKLGLLLPLINLFDADGVIFAGVAAAMGAALLRLWVMAGTVHCKIWHLLRVVICKLLPIIGLLGVLWGLRWVLDSAGTPLLLTVIMILCIQVLGLLFLIRKPTDTHHRVVSAICPRLHGGG